MEAIRNKIEKINSIANSPIPVSEECGIHQVFLERRKIAEKMQYPASEDVYELLDKNLEYVEDLIRKYFYL